MCAVVRKILATVMLCVLILFATLGCCSSMKCTVGAAQSAAPGKTRQPYSERRERVIEWLEARGGYNDHVRKVVRYAELINQENAASADPRVVEIAALLHDCGYQVGRGPKKKVRDLHAELGAAAARGLLPTVGFSSGFTDHVSRIVDAHHSVDAMDTSEWRAVWMADLAVNNDMTVTEKTVDRAVKSLQKKLDERREGAEDST